MGLQLQTAIFFLRVVTLTTFSLTLCFVYMVEKVNVSVRELWISQRRDRGCVVSLGQAGKNLATEAHLTSPVWEQNSFSRDGNGQGWAVHSPMAAPQGRRPGRAHLWQGWRQHPMLGQSLMALGWAEVGPGEKTLGPVCP